MTDLILLNDRLLGEVDELLGGPMQCHYAKPCGHVFSSTIGQHVRHCLEHYEELLQAIREDRVLDYERRPRDPEVENHPLVARRRIEAVRAAIHELASGPEIIAVRDHGDAAASQSSITRELQFLISHTVHHFALIAVIAASAGLELPADFGIAPTTLKFRRSS